MKPARSIRQGLSRVVVQISIAWSVAVFGVVWLAVHEQIDVVLDSALQESAEILYGLFNANSGQMLAGAGEAMPAPVHSERLVWQLVSADHRVLWRSHRAPAQPLSTGPQEPWSDTHPQWHVYGMPFDAKGAMLYVAQTHNERRQIRLQAAVLTAAGALVVGVACALWLRRRVAQELEPLSELSEQVSLYHPMEAGSTPPVATREELVPLRQAIVHLGDRLAQHVASERAFSAHAAHALRTPLAGLGAQLALAMRESTPAVRPRIGRAREAADRLSRVVSALLSLFRSGSEPCRQQTDLTGFIQGLPPVDGLDVSVAGEGVWADIDPDLLAAALINLLDNALRHGAKGVWFVLSQDAPFTVITLLDDGPGMDEASRQRVGAALASQQYDQLSGLGLMLADRVARAHGGQLSLVPVDQGFGVALSIGPRAAV
jgi:signal transduction histidine kinase